MSGRAFWGRAIAIVACAVSVLLARPASADPVAVDDEGNVDQTRPAKPNGIVEVDVGAGALRFVATTRPEVKVTGRLDGAELDISSSADRTRIRMIRSNRPHEAEIEIRLPRGSRVEAKAVSATISVEGVAGAVRIESVSGDTSVTGPAAEVSVRSASGDIRLDVSSPLVSARSISGAVHVSGARGRATIESVSGDCVLEGGDFTDVEMSAVSGDVQFQGGIGGQGSVEFKTHSGRIELHLPSKTNADFELRTFSGNIESHLGGARHASSALDFRVGNGGARVRGRSFSGDIEIDPKK